MNQFLFGINLNFIGSVAALLLCSSSVPQLIKTLYTKNVSGLSFWMLILWFCGCFLMLIYVIAETPTIPLMVTYLLNSTISLSLIILYLRYQ